MDLSKVSDTINYELLIAKLYAYGFFKDVLKHERCLDFQLYVRPLAKKQD